MSQSLMVDRFYEMDPEFEDLIRGDALQNGMIVLIESTTLRGDLERMGANSSEMQRCREINQWCEVTELEITSRWPSPLVSFLGIYGDGRKRPRAYDASWYWIVKLDSIPTVVS